MIFQAISFFKQFDIKRVNTSANRLQPSQLDSCNRLEIHRQISDPDLCDKLVEQVRELIRKSFANE